VGFCPSGTEPDPTFHKAELPILPAGRPAEMMSPQNGRACRFCAAKRRGRSGVTTSHISQFEAESHIEIGCAPLLPRKRACLVEAERDDKWLKPSIEMGLGLDKVWNPTVRLLPHQPGCKNWSNVGLRRFTDKAATLPSKAGMRVPPCNFTRQAVFPGNNNN